jgi:hypothetical protein
LFVRQFLGAAIFVSLLATPVIASAAMVDPSLVPDGTYTAKVEKVVDPAHLLVAMENGVETTFTPVSGTFNNVKVNDTIKVTLIQGKVRVYALQ